MNLSAFAEVAFLNLLRGQDFTAPAQVYAGLFLTSPTDGGTGGVEVSYSGYTRLPIVFDVPTVVGEGIGVRNSQQVTFARAVEPAGTVRHVGIFDSPTGGNMYLYGELTTDLPIEAGEEPVLLLNEVLFFSVGDLSTAYKTKLFNVVRGISIPGITPYLSLWNGDPENGGMELSGELYARVPLTFAAPAKGETGTMLTRTTTNVAFARPTSNWGVCSYVVIFDSDMAF